MAIRFRNPGDTPAGAGIDADIVARVAAKAALEVGGVVAVEGAAADGIAAALGRDGRAPGVRVTAERDGCSFHIGVVIKYGERVPEVAWNLQEHVKNTVEKLIGVRVINVNILIAGIRDVAADSAAGAAYAGEAAR
jgi:uncharacterized alkaline shock family protein YloU